MDALITRREAFRRLAALAVSARVAGQNTPHVVILGAGLSGLVAGYTLQEKGIPFTILEARPRPGGRVETLRECFAEGLSAEAGAIFVHDDHDLTMRFCMEFGLTLDPFTGGYLMGEYFARGKRIRAPESEGQWPQALTPEERKLGLTGLQQKYVAQTAATIGDIHDPSWPSREALRLDAISLKDLFLNGGASSEASDLMRLGFYDLAGDGLKSHSALSAMRDWLVEAGMSAAYSIRGGTDQLPRAFANLLNVNIHYGCVADRIEQNGTGVTVHFTKGGEKRSLTGSHALCTIPFSLAKNLKFTPEVSAAKRRAMNELPYTSVTRVYLQTATRFWKDSEFRGTLTTDLPVMWVRDATVNQTGARGILESYMAGKQARSAAALRPDQRTGEVAKQMEVLFPGLKDQLEGGCAKVWDDDPFARGGYCYYKPGQIAAIWPHVGTPEGRIHFAGEHTSASPGWMQGALASGVRAADEIRQALGR
jgi:monoamine oxidase